MGERIAAKGITVVDNGTMPDRRGSITIDDEGTPSGCTTLIEDGILVGLMQDRLNARLMGVSPTGNGRRQSYAHAPMPRMTNTYMLSGDKHPEEILRSIKSGLFAKSFGGGQVDITSGKFVFSCTEAYLIEDGKITAARQGCHADRRRRGCPQRASRWSAMTCRTRSRGRHLRQAGPGRAGGRRPAQLAHRRTDRWRHRGVNHETDAVIFDMDDVLCRYDLGKRLRALSRITGTDAARHPGRDLGFGLRG